jgi:cellulose biosynthesis protein BcsQ
MRIYEALDDGPFLLRRILSYLADEYDIVVIDVGHSTPIIQNIMAVADLLVVPTPALFPDADHVGDMIQVAGSVRAALGLPKLDMLKRSVISIWRRQATGTADRIVIELLRQTYGELVAPAIIPNSGYVGHANKERLSIREYRDRYGQKRDHALHALVDAYSDLADYVLERVPKEVAAA